MKSMDMMKVFRPLGLALVLLAFASVTSWATETEEIEALKTRLNQLEKEHAEEAGLEKQAETQGPELSGAIRFNYRLDDFNASEKDRGGNLTFDLFRLGVDGSYQNIVYSAQYRWNSYQDFVHHAFIGYNLSDTLGVQLGITQVPFGNMPYDYHNFWGGIPYYIGLDDDYDMGLKVIKTAGPWDLQVAFFKNDEWGDASKLERYSYDVVTGAGQANEETNQVNARLAYTADHGDFGQTELGLSGEWGQLYNSASSDMGDHWAAAAHLNGYYGPFNLLLQVAEYRYNPENPAGVDSRTVLMGAFSDSFPVAAEGTVYSGGLSYDLPVNWGPISKLTFYEDYSRLVKKESGFEDSQINTLGCMVTAGPIYTYIDAISGKNALYLDGPGNSFAAGDPNPEWGTKFNINIGYYF